jgi:Cu/Zn superoxide dismutase
MKTFLLKPALLAGMVLLVLAPALARTKLAKSTVGKLQNAQGKAVGTATLSPGEHAIHIHHNAKCEAPDFKSAGVDVQAVPS